MERKSDDVNKENLEPEELNEMEARRIDELNQAGIDERDVLHKAGENLNAWNNYFNENIVRGKDDVNFVVRDQWTAVERSEFTRLFKPAMTFNKLYDAVKKVVGEQRKNKPDLIVRSLTGKATQEQIDLRADLVRTISYQSQNDLVYQTAFKNALMMGFGCFQILLDYESPRSFNRVIKYGLVNDPTTCSWDPTALKPHKGDGNYCSRRFIFTRDEFFATFPYITNPVSFSDPYLVLDFQRTTRDTVIVCDEFIKEWYPLIIYKLSNGDVCTEEEWKEREKSFEDNMEIVRGSAVEDIVKRDIPKIIGKRQTQDYKIMHYRMLQNQIIDFSEWPSRNLPIPFVDGDSYYIEGRQYTKSFIHEARDAQKCVNYFNSEIAAEIKNRRREQWLGTPDNIIGYEQDWRNPELQMGILRAKPDPKTGQMPTKQSAWDLSPALMANSQRATQDINEILGFSEAEQLQGKDISGKARRERKLEGSMSAYVFFDNLNQAIEQGGRVVNDLLPYIVGEDERHMMLSKKDGKTKTMIMNQKDEDGEIMNQLDKGEYDVEIDTGPSFAVQQDVALEFLQQTLQTFPQAFPLVADLWAKNLDVQFGPQIVERLESLVPPQILAKERGEPAPLPKPDPQQMMMQQQMMMAQQEMQHKEEKLKLDQQKLQLEAGQIQDRQAELAIRQQKHELEKQEMALKAHEVLAKQHMEHKTHLLDADKAEMDFTAKVAKIYADSHAKKMQHEAKRE